MPKIVDKQKKAAEIAEAALGVFRTRGYHATRIIDVAKAAGIGKGTVYEYFDDKSAILRHCFDNYFEAFEQGALQAVAATNGSAQRLLALVDFALAHVDEWEDHCAVYVDYFGLARRDDPSVLSLASLYEQFRGLLRALIEEGQREGVIRADVNAASVASLLVTIYDGIILHGIFEPRSESREAMRETIIKVITRGLISSS